MTLDEFLRKVDRWKQAVSDEMAKRTPVERALRDHEAIEWLEAEIRHRLRRDAGRGSGLGSDGDNAGKGERPDARDADADAGVHGSG